MGDNELHSLCACQISKEWWMMVECMSYLCTGVELDIVAKWLEWFSLNANDELGDGFEACSSFSGDDGQWIDD